MLAWKAQHYHVHFFTNSLNSPFLKVGSFHSTRHNNYSPSFYCRRQNISSRHEQPLRICVLISDARHSGEDMAIRSTMAAYERVNDQNLSKEREHKRSTSSDK